MIVADRKPLEEILESIKEYKKIMLMGCGGCVTICFSGGAKAVELLASQIRIAREKQGNPIEIIECIPERQCEFEFIDALKKDIESVEAVLSLACGVGVQTMSERHEDTITIPGQNTKFMGSSWAIPLSTGSGRKDVPVVEIVCWNGPAVFVLSLAAPRSCSTDPAVDRPTACARSIKIRNAYGS